MVLEKPTVVAKVGSVNINFIKQTEVLSVVKKWNKIGHRGYVVLINPHSVMMCQRDSAMHEASADADLVLPDGVGIVLAAKILGHGKQYRVTGPALMLNLCDVGRAVGLRHYFYGGDEGVAEKLSQVLTERFPGLQVAGTYCPPFKPLSEEEDSDVVQMINAARPDVVWVGLGAPKQERWMRAHVGRIHATALIGVGAAFDFHSGNVPWAPRWVRNIGCEWAYRLAMEPRRMWRRNLDSPLFLANVIGQAIGVKMRRLAGVVAPVVEAIDRDPGVGGSGGAAVGGTRLVLPRPAATATAVGSPSSLEPVAGAA